jgi:hypothetical protein
LFLKRNFFRPPRLCTRSRERVRESRGHACEVCAGRGRCVRGQAGVSTRDALASPPDTQASPQRLFP